MKHLSITRTGHRAACGALWLLTLLLPGCESFHASSSRVRKDAPSVADHGCALLFDLLGDEQNVSKLLIIKRERAEFRNLIKEIARRSADAHQQLEAFAKADAQLNLKDRGLPATEVETRKSISKAQAKELLTDTGKDFELQMLLSQNEALTYGAHLAAATAKVENNPERMKFLQQLSSDLAQLQRKVAGMLSANYSWSR